MISLRSIFSILDTASFIDLSAYTVVSFIAVAPITPASEMVCAMMNTLLIVLYAWAMIEGFLVVVLDIMILVFRLARLLKNNEVVSVCLCVCFVCVYVWGGI